MQHYKGACHCGNVQFSMDTEIEQAIECNCSICAKKGYLLHFLPADQFESKITTALTTYQFAEKTIQHHFCPTCGVSAFSQGEQGGQQMVAINLRCVDDFDLSSVKIVPYDGLSV